MELGGLGHLYRDSPTVTKTKVCERNTSQRTQVNIMYNYWLMLRLFVLLLYVPSQQLMSCRDRQFTWLRFFLDKLEEAVNQYFVHILSFVTDNNPSWMIQRKGGINLHRSMGPGRDQTCDPWICSQTHICCQTRYRLRYAARLMLRWIWSDFELKILYNYWLLRHWTWCDVDLRVPILTEVNLGILFKHICFTIYGHGGYFGEVT